jgi:hypothetical protein
VRFPTTVMMVSPDMVINFPFVVVLVLSLLQ